MVVGIASAIAGGRGFAGLDTRVTVSFMNFQLVHTDCAVDAHCAFKTSARRVNLLPTETVPNEPGNTTRVLGSLGHWQEAKEAPTNRRTEEQLKTLLLVVVTMPAPWLVAESKVSRIELPSLENMAESRRGVGGSWCASMIIRESPRRNTTSYSPLEGPDTDALMM